MNSIVAGLGSPFPIGVDCMCTKAKFTSVLVSKHFFMVHFANFMQGSTHP